MKKILEKIVVSSVFVFLLMCTTLTYAEATVPVYFNSEPVTLSQNPVIQNGTTLVPFKNIFEAFGFSVKWDGNTKTITGYNDNTNIVLQLGNNIAVVNGKEKQMSIAPQVINGNTMVPLRFVAESVGYDVGWNGDNAYVTIGDVDQDLIDIYEYSNSVHLNKSGTILRYADVYIVDGTGYYAGYKEIIGHPYTGYHVYYKGDHSAFNIETTHLDYHLEEIVEWGYQDHTIRSTKNEIFDYLNGISSLSSYSDYINSDDLQATFGKTYDEWLDYRMITDDLSDIAEGYLGYIDGSAFDSRYSRYIDYKFMTSIFAPEPSDDQSDISGMVVTPESSNVEISSEDTVQKEWLSESLLKENYGVKFYWLGENIDFYKGGDKIFVLTGSPSSSFVADKIYTSNEGIRFQYDNGIVFNFDDLVAKGIIEQ